MLQDQPMQSKCGGWTKGKGETCKGFRKGGQKMRGLGLLVRMDHSPVKFLFNSIYIRMELDRAAWKKELLQEIRILLRERCDVGKRCKV